MFRQFQKFEENDAAAGAADMIVVANPNMNRGLPKKKGGKKKKSSSQQKKKGGAKKHVNKLDDLNVIFMVRLLEKLAIHTWCWK